MVYGSQEEFLVSKSEEEYKYCSDGGCETKRNGDEEERDLTRKQLRKRIQNLPPPVKITSSDSLYVISEDKETKDKQTPCTVSSTCQAKSGTTDEREQDEEFGLRPSLLTELYERHNIRSIDHIIVSTIVILVLQTVVGWITTGSFGLHIDLLFKCLRQLDKAILIWSIMNLSLIILYYGFNVWARFRTYVKTGLWDVSWITLYVTYSCVIIYVPLVYLLHYNIPSGCSVIVLVEQVRLTMKHYAFVRTNVVPSLEPTDEIKNGRKRERSCPELRKFTYFLFAPTLIYKNEYIRTPHIRTSYVLFNLVQLVLCVHFATVIMMNFGITPFKTFGLEPITAAVIINSVLSCILPALLLTLLVFYGILHCWLNLTAEVLRFGDRRFYTDWWVSTSYAEFYRSWNTVVKDWLRHYIYEDMHKLLQSWRFGRQISMTLVLVISAIGHEYIITFSSGHFKPVNFILHAGCGVFALFSRWNRYSFWVTLILGFGIVMSFHCMELSARTNCPPHQDEFMDLLIPRIWTCYNAEK